MKNIISFVLNAVVVWLLFQTGFATYNAPQDDFIVAVVVAIAGILIGYIVLIPLVVFFAGILVLASKAGRGALMFATGLTVGTIFTIVPYWLLRAAFWGVNTAVGWDVMLTTDKWLLVGLIMSVPTLIMADFKKKDD